MGISHLAYPTFGPPTLLVLSCLVIDTCLPATGCIAQNTRAAYEDLCFYGGGEVEIAGLLRELPL